MSKEVDELRSQIAGLESELDVKAKTISELEGQLAYQLKAVQDLVKTIGPPPLVGGTFSSFPWCVRASTDTFGDALIRADTVEKRVADLEEKNNELQLRLSEVERDLEVSTLQVSEHILRAKSLQLDLEGAREELAAARSALKLAHKNHKEHIARVDSFYQKDAAAKARVIMLNACYLQYPDFDWSVVRRHLQAPKIERKVIQLRKSDPLLQTPGGESPSQKPASATPFK